MQISCNYITKYLLCVIVDINEMLCNFFHRTLHIQIKIDCTSHILSNSM